jgi:hypothetical protein
VRVYELLQTYPNNAPVINGLKLVEVRTGGIGDRIDGSGDGTLYYVFVLENGDRFFARNTNVVQSIAGKLTSTQVGYITGGTGKFVGMQGIVRGSSIFDLKAGTNDGQGTIEYSIGK